MPSKLCCDCVKATNNSARSSIEMFFTRRDNRKSESEHRIHARLSRGQVRQHVNSDKSETLKNYGIDEFRGGNNSSKENRYLYSLANFCQDYWRHREMFGTRVLGTKRHDNDLGFFRKLMWMFQEDV